MDFTRNADVLQSITLSLFFAGTVAMGAGALYFFLLRTEVDPAYRSTMVVAGLICAIACFHDTKMTAVYQQSGGDFPTALRSVDWLFTTPLLLVTFPLLLRMGDRGTRFFWQLVLLDVAMIVTAFIAETSSVDSPRWWTLFLVSCGFELLIVGVLFLQLGQAIDAAPAPLAGGSPTSWPQLGTALVRIHAAALPLLVPTWFAIGIAWWLRSPAHSGHDLAILSIAAYGVVTPAHECLERMLLGRPHQEPAAPCPRSSVSCSA